jgi:hypothetical protein
MALALALASFSRAEQLRIEKEQPKGIFGSLRNKAEFVIMYI